MSSLFGSVRTGVLWSSASFFAGRALTFVSTLVLARVLAPADFGVVAAIIVYLGLIELGSDIGMNATLVYEQETGITKRVQTAFTLNLLAATTLTIVGVLAAPLVASLFGMSAHTGLFRLSALNLLGIGLGNIQDGLLMRALAFRRRAIPAIIRALVRGGVSIALALAGFGAGALVGGMLAGTATWAIVLWIMAPFRPTLRIDRRIARSMASYGGAAAVLEIVSVVASRVDAIVVGRVLGPTALGLYTMAFRIPELLIDSLSWNVSSVAFPALARKRAIDSGGLGPAAMKQLRYQSLFGVPIAAGLAVLAPPIMVTLFSAKWAPAAGVMSAVAVASGLYSMAFPLGDVFKALGRQRTILALNAVQVPLLIAVIVAVAHEGIVAVAWARTGMAAVFALVLIAAVLRVVHMRPSDAARAVGPALLAAVGVAIGAGAVRLLWPSLSAGPAVVGTVAGALGGFVALRAGSPASLGDLRALLPTRSAASASDAPVR